MFTKTKILVVTAALTAVVINQAYAAVDSAPERAPIAGKSVVDDPVFAKKIDERVAKIVATLDIADDAVKTRVHGTIVAQYRLLNIWHEKNDARLKELAKEEKDAAKAASAKEQVDAIKASLKTLHSDYLASLAKDLNAEQIERVKDGMTAGKVKFTYTGYVNEYPGMNEEQKAKVLEFLKEAREESMDAGSMDEKSAIFNRYKGRINNWLSKQGIGSARSKKAVEAGAPAKK